MHRRMKLNNSDTYLKINFSESPVNVNAYTTLRIGGFSTGDYNEYNLATHVGDNEATVNKNRTKLVEDLALPSEPVWLNQVHSNRVIYINKNDALKTEDNLPIQADASVASEKGIVCTVMTADCLPVFFCNKAGTEVAVAHAGWRGLHAGIISNTLKSMNSSVEDILVSLGPAIGPKVFQVGEEMKQTFVEKNQINMDAFLQTSTKKYLCDIYKLAQIELCSAGVTHVESDSYCTYSDSNKFYSYRKQKQTGRMASLIWLG